MAEQHRVVRAAALAGLFDHRVATTATATAAIGVERQRHTRTSVTGYDMTRC
ncbi:hypothetical protein [Jiangella aurantiaca]|uniref:hypothetical protein n=1 Tax=Jiangella aurantiaca TaxID=2530373 RepID=UPI0013A5DC41|nr:hypothetical protein [Jiangella aurantiaca]